MMSRIDYVLMSMLIVSATAPALLADTYLINPNSTYEFLVPPEGPGIPGCQPDDFHCDFLIAGSLDFEIDFIAGRGAFVGADLQLFGNEGTSEGPTFPVEHADSVEGFLLSVGPIPLESSSGGVLLFRQPIPPPPGVRWDTLEVTIRNNQLRLVGGHDLTPSDGSGNIFNVTATVPEPTGLTAMSCCLALFLAPRRNRLSS
jgi:hypothetical protein